MIYSQAIPFNQSLGGKTPNYCLANVCKGYSIANKYASAWQAWQHTQQHSGQSPTGLDVPVFFSYTATIDGDTANWGHIGVRLADGRFWSDGNLYPSIAVYESSHSPRYVGWGESVNERIIISSKEEDVATKASLEMSRILAYFIGGWKDALNGKDDDELNKSHVGQDLEAEVRNWYNSPQGNAQAEKLAQGNSDAQSKLEQIKRLLGE